MTDPRLTNTLYHISETLKGINESVKAIARSLAMIEGILDDAFPKDEDKQ